MKKIISLSVLCLIIMASSSLRLSAGTGTGSGNDKSTLLTTHNNLIKTIAESNFLSDQALLKKRHSSKKGPKILAGIQGGYTISIVTGVLEHRSIGSRYNMGIFGVYMIDQKLGFQLDLNLETKGFTIKTTYADVPPSYDVKQNIVLTYITIPVMVKYFLGGSNHFYVNGGPCIGILNKAVNTISSTIPGSQSSDNDIKSSMNSTDFGFSFGCGYTYPVLESGSFDANIFCDLRLTTGLNNIYKDATLYNLKNQSGSVKLGVMIGIK
ncbi:MAG: porin family protein [Bacteroidia bacterium]|nr:porin family protein [Bacteroidia bacterium]